MRQLGRDADFAQEAVCAERRRDFGSQDFDRHLAPVLLFFREVYRRHTPASQFPLDGVAIGECDGDALSRRSEEHTSELQSLAYLVCRLLLEKKKKRTNEVCC